MGTFYVGAEVVADLPQDEVDVVLPRDGVGRHAGGRVGRPGDGHLLPGQEEDDASITCGRVEQAHVVGAEGRKKPRGAVVILTRSKTVRSDQRIDLN